MSRMRSKTLVAKVGGHALPGVRVRVRGQGSGVRSQESGVRLLMPISDPWLLTPDYRPLIPDSCLLIPRSLFSQAEARCRSTSYSLMRSLVTQLS